MEIFIKRFFAYTIDCILLMLLAKFFMLFSPSFWVLMALRTLSEMLYFTYLEQSKNQATIGKKLFKLKVIDEKGNRLSIKKAFVRNICFFLCFFSRIL